MDKLIVWENFSGKVIYSGSDPKLARERLIEAAMTGRARNVGLYELKDIVEVSYKTAPVAQR